MLGTFSLLVMICISLDSIITHSQLEYQYASMQICCMVVPKFLTKAMNKMSSRKAERDWDGRRHYCLIEMSLSEGKRKSGGDLKGFGLKLNRVYMKTVDIA